VTYRMQKLSTKKKSHDSSKRRGGSYDLENQLTPSLPGGEVCSGKGLSACDHERGGRLGAWKTIACRPVSLAGGGLENTAKVCVRLPRMHREDRDRKKTVRSICLDHPCEKDPVESTLTRTGHSWKGLEG